MYKYINGNRLVTLDPESGTKRRYKPINCNDEYQPTRPENIDLNISDKCTEGCVFCYLDANSNKSDCPDILDKIDNIWPSTLDLKGLEVAINWNKGYPLDRLRQVCQKIRERNAVPNLTVNFKTITQIDLNEVTDIGAQWFGISVTNVEEIEIIKQRYPSIVSRTVFHVINRIFTQEELECVRDAKLLVLGYKRVGRGKIYAQHTGADLDISKADKSVQIAFDNLAVDQLNLKHKYPKEYERTYLGPDGNHSFYIDLVNDQFSTSSTTKEIDRYPINGQNIQEMFKKIKESKCQNTH